MRAGHLVKVDNQATHDGLKLGAFQLNPPLVPWAMGERPHLALGRPTEALGSHNGPVVLSIPLAVAAKELVTHMAYSHAQGRLHDIQPHSPRVRNATADVMQQAGDHPTIRAWLLSTQDGTNMDALAVHIVLGVLYAFQDRVSRVMMKRPSGIDQWYPYGQMETKASVSEVLTDYHALWQRA